MDNRSVQTIGNRKIKFDWQRGKNLIDGSRNGHRHSIEENIFSMRWCYFFAGFLMAAAAVGCSSSSDPSARVAELNRTNILKVSSLYAAYQMGNGLVGPKDADALKQFVKNGTGLSPRRLEMMHVDPNKLDEIFVSERDHKPFKVKPSVPWGLNTVSAVVFEDTGEGGVREVGFTNSTVQELDDAKYNELWQGKEASSGSKSSGSEAAKTGG